MDLNAEVMIDCVSREDRSSGVSIGSVTTASSDTGESIEYSYVKLSCSPGDGVLARRPGGNLLSSVRGTRDGRRLFSGPATAPE